MYNDKSYQLDKIELISFTQFNKCQDFKMLLKILTLLFVIIQKTRQEKERLLKFKNKLDALKQKVKDKDRAIQQKEKAAKKMVQLL